MRKQSIMDRKEFLALAVSPLLIPLLGCVRKKELVGRFVVRAAPLTGVPIRGDDPIPTFGFLHLQAVLTVWDGDEAVLGKSVEQREDYFDFEECKRLLKSWAKEYHPELNIKYEV
jgi:hypothetical protein